MKRRLEYRLMMIFGLILFIGGPGLPNAEGQVEMPDPRHSVQALALDAGVMLEGSV